MFALDPVQQQILDLNAAEAALVLGDPGCGKTTAATHRAAALARGGARVLVLVVGAGLGGAWTRQLARLGARADVHTLDAWLAREGLRCFPDLDRRLGEDASPDVIAFKRHPAALAAFDGSRVGPRATRDDLLDGFGDASALAAALEVADGALCERMAEAVRAHAEIQAMEVERDSHGRPILAADGEPLHVGTPANDAGTVDLEDLPVLFALDRFRHPPRRWDHVVLDEAQEVGPLEHGVVRAARRAGAGLTVVGDAAQQVDPTAWFAGWEAALGALGAADARRFRLDRSFRCPEAVLELARRLRDGGSAPPSEPWADLLARSVGRTVVIAWSPAAAREAWRAVTRHVPARLALDEVLPGADTVVAPVDAIRGLEFDRVLVAGADTWPTHPHARNALFLAVTRARREVAFGADLRAPGTTGTSDRSGSRSPRTPAR